MPAVSIEVGYVVGLMNLQNINIDMWGIYDEIPEKEIKVRMKTFEE